MKIKMDGNQPKGIEKCFRKFMKKNKVRNLSEDTIRFYNETYNRFYSFLEERGINRAEKVVEETIDNHIIYLRGDDIKATSINTYLRGIRAFLYYCMNNGWMNKFKVQLLECDNNIKETFSKKQLKKLLKKPKGGFTKFANYRNRMIILFLVSTGIRAKSLINIKIKDLDFENEIVNITYTKGRHAQILPLPQKLINELEGYLEIRGKEDNKYLFPTVYDKQLSRSGAITAIKRYNTKRDVLLTSLHAFRHSFSRYFLANGGSIQMLKKYLGHKNIKTTNNYIHTLIEDYEGNLEDTNPINDLLDSNETIKI